jgi:two-component system, NtrC family, nitrogen regulation response regulator GlnG
MAERPEEGARAGRPRFVERRSGARVRVPSLTVLWHPDVGKIGRRVRLAALLEGHEAVLSRSGPGFQPPGHPRAHPLDHPALDGLRVRFSAGEPYGAVRVRVPEGEEGVEVDGLPLGTEGVSFSLGQLDGGVVLEIRDTVVLLLHTLSAREQWEPMDFGLVGDSEGLVDVRREIRRVADLEIPVLLRGETGTGKELMARAIHRASRRREQPYLSVNLGAIPPTLAASELFGAAKGAYTGSVRPQPGYFVRAHRGTLFLDEIGEAPPEVQVMLLRVLESGEIQQLGVQETQTVDVRMIAATDLDLEAAAEDGDFRAPLLHRLAGYEIVVPPLRERRDDFGRLLLAFLREELDRVGEGRRLEEPERVSEWLPVSIVARLARHEWPGNVRQVRNAARQIAIGSRGSDTVRIGPQLERLLQEAVGPRSVAPADAAGPAPTPFQAPPPAAPRKRKEYRDPSEVDDDELLEALRRNRWSVKPTAEELKVSRTSLYGLIDRHPKVRKASEIGEAELVRVRDECGGDLDEMGRRLEVSSFGLRQRMKELGL